MSKDLQMDLKAVKKMQEEFKQCYEDRLKELNNTYQKGIATLKFEYSQQAEKIEQIYQTIQKKNEAQKREQEMILRKVEQEKNEILMERQRVALETQKLMKIQATSQDIQNAAPSNSQQYYQIEQETNVVYLDRMQSSSSKSQIAAQKKKKAADYYFQKGNTQNGDKPMSDISKTTSPQKLNYKNVNGGASPIINKGGFTYDKLEDLDSSIKKTQAPSSLSKSPLRTQTSSQMSPTNNSWKNKPIQASTTPKSTSIKAYVPAPQQLKSQPPIQQIQTVIAPQVSNSPQLPNSLHDEFEKEPQNYPGILPALHDQENFKISLEKWKKSGILYAADVIRNNPGSSIDYNLGVGLNQIQSGFGQIDKQGKLQGIGREVQDFIYEGQFKNNVFDGWGRYIDHQGIYWGFWTNGLRNGRGKWMSTNGETKEGNWSMGIMK